MKNYDVNLRLPTFQNYFLPCYSLQCTMTESFCLKNDSLFLSHQTTLSKIMLMIKLYASGQKLKERKQILN